MNTYLHHHQNRGHVHTDWLNTYHSFSFGQWHDRRFMGIGALRVINDDTIAAHRGFGTHPHDNMEILTYVVSGAITHKDSMGNHGQIHAGEWQLMSAGTGVEHSEVNQHDTPVHLFQIWIHPNIRNAKPNYQQVSLDPKTQPNQWHVIAGPEDNALMHIRQSAEVKTAFLDQDQTLELERQHDVNYVHVISGQIKIGQQILNPGDALAFTTENQMTAMSKDSHVLWFDLPQ
ncbi:pirin family protein [Acinetobacter sp. B5B]|uniref:pirin family protein n=1 Tax=Acinetobacter baretiae TaxID=2605383 RepID=UPI0018C2F3F5|nr:pirin-like bicupin family protein [Acinetobacter baretiae]MBF7682092.1 pirin family protein [Acinetobacter baretiae]